METRTAPAEIVELGELPYIYATHTVPLRDLGEATQSGIATVSG